MTCSQEESAISLEKDEAHLVPADRSELMLKLFLLGLKGS